METKAKSPRRWIDKYLSSSWRDAALESISAHQKEEMRAVGNLYKHIASHYLTEKKLDENFLLIFDFLLYIYKRGKRIHMVTEDDLFDYFIWIFRKGCPKEAWLATAASIADFIHVLLQEGTIARNPLLKVYRIMRDGDAILAGLKEDPSFDAFVEGNDTPGKPDPPPSPEAFQPVAAPPLAAHARREVLRVSPAADLPIPSEALDPPEPHTAASRTRQDDRFVERRRPFWNRIRRYGLVSLFLVVVLAGALFYLPWHLLSNDPTAVEPSPVANMQEKEQEQSPFTNRESVQQGHSMADKSVDYFYKNNMKNYYCREYLKTSCSANQLLVNPLAADLENIYEGGKYYIEYCARCHGDTGRGNGADAVRQNWTVEKLSWAGSELLDRDAYLFWIIAKGGHDFGGRMPSYKDVLDEKKIWKVILFLKTLR
ncbi:MAG: cytochrome c [Magnetococcales bacterium]|nr:cytochrome c [Magnetococcales bacterium]